MWVVYASNMVLVLESYHSLLVVVGLWLRSEFAKSSLNGALYRKFHSPPGPSKYSKQKANVAEKSKKKANTGFQAASMLTFITFGGGGCHNLLAVDLYMKESRNQTELQTIL